jgi:hypothetical protein
MEQNLKLDALLDDCGGILAPEDLHFFYYDIALDHLSGRSAMYERTDKVKSFMSSKDLIIDEKEQSELPDDFETNRIYFTVNEKNDGSIDGALFRHLRNALAHFNVRCQGDFFLMKDFELGKQVKMTMIGKVRCEDLRQFCFLLFDQREQFEDKSYIHSINGQKL